MYIPPGFTTVTPYFVVINAASFIRFLINGLGGKEVLRSLRADGAIANAQVKLGTSMLMIGEAPAADKVTSGTYYLYVANADEAMQKAMTHGAELVMEVSNMDYGDRQGGVRDPHGNIWWISQRLVVEPYGN